MKKSFLIVLLIFVAVINSGAFWHPKKQKCKKPIYFFENTRKEEYFTHLDNIVQQYGYEIEKMQMDYAFLSVNYEIKRDKIVPVALVLKQFGNDTYLFIDIEKNNTQLEKDIYNELKKHSKNSYLMNNDLFCTQLTRDANSIRTGRKPILQESQYNPGVYVMDIKRYVGYDKKVYKWEKFKEKFKRKKKKENSVNETL